MNEKITTLLLGVVMATGLAGCAKTVSYGDVEPVFSEKCASCHSGDHEGVMKSGFSVESYEAVMKGTSLGPVIVPGSSASSSLYRMVAGKTDLEIQMPHGGERLDDDQVEMLRAWIDQGAVR